MAIFNARQLKAIQDFQDNALNTLGKMHRLFFPSIYIDCSHCLTPAYSGFAANAGLHGGPLPNLCVNCGGSGKIKKEVTDTILLEVDFEPRQTLKSAEVNVPSVKLPWNIVVVKGYLRDLPKLQQCNEIQLDLPSFPVTSGRYRLGGDGIDAFNIVQGRYFLATLVRIS